MRIWLNPDRMRAYNVSTDDVMKALDEQSVIGSPGRLGQPTGKTSQSLEYVLTYEGRFNKPEQYENIILRANPDGEILRLKDVAEVELGSRVLRHLLQPRRPPLGGHRAQADLRLQRQRRHRGGQGQARGAEEDQSFPPGMDYEISYDVSSFLDASIEKVLHTLLEAFILVALVVFLFLGDWRSTLIPTLAVPVSLIGTFFFMQLFGLTINLITLFALVLAIGIVVDNAIVVVEAVHAKMAEEHLSPYNARAQGAGRDQRRHHRHHADDDGRVRAGGVHDRAGRHLLPPVRHHDGHVHRALRRRGPDAHAGALRHDPEEQPRPAQEAHADQPLLRLRSTAASRR